MIEFNEILTLKKSTVTTDKIGNPIDTFEKADVLVAVKSATRRERYLHSRHNYFPEYVVTLNKWDYDGQTDCEFRGEEYKITFKYESDDEYDLIELTLSKVE